VIHDVAARLTEALSAPPAPLLPSASIAPRRPAASGDLPAVAISVTVERAEELGWGRLVRGSDLLPDGREREDYRGERLAGTVGFEVWAGQATAAGQLSRDLDAKLRSVRATLRERGFALLRPAALEAMEGLRHEGGTGAAFTAWRQRLAYRFVYEGVEGGALTAAGVIRRVDVGVDEWDESFTAPAPAP
jgi:hypothetical protein